MRTRREQMLADTDRDHVQPLVVPGMGGRLPTRRSIYGPSYSPGRGLVLVGYAENLSAQPVEDHPLYDPADILEALPPTKREHFLAQYEKVVEAARRPAEFHRLHELLHLWSLKAKMYATNPNFDRSPDEVLAELANSDGGAYLEDVAPEFRQRLRRGQTRGR